MLFMNNSNKKTKVVNLVYLANAIGYFRDVLFPVSKRGLVQNLYHEN